VGSRSHEVKDNPLNRARAAAIPPAWEPPAKEEPPPLPDGWRRDGAIGADGEEEEWFVGLDKESVWERPTLPFGWLKESGFDENGAPEV